jgi:hypothetical protein
VLWRSVVSNNSAGFNNDGGIYNTGQLLLTNSTVISNTASCNSFGGSGGNGGGIENVGQLVLSNSTIAGNSAISGIFNNCGGLGGGIYNTGTLLLFYATVASNSSGLDNNFGTVALTGTIVANSTAGPNCSGPLTESQGDNLDSGTSCGFSESADLTNTDPLLGPLASNGGPTQTMALLRGSPAIDHGGTRATGCPARDQRGLPRPDESSDNGACDMGAYESQGIG